MSGSSKTLMQKLKQANFKSAELFFQKFEELALEADAIKNEQVMTDQVKKAIWKNVKDTIYTGDNNAPWTYEQWKSGVLWMDYNYQLNDCAPWP